MAQFRRSVSTSFSRVPTGEISRKFSYNASFILVIVNNFRLSSFIFFNNFPYSGHIFAIMPMSLLKNRFGPKVILCVWWNSEGVIHWEFVVNWHAVDADLSSQQQEWIHEILRLRYPALVNWNRVPWQQDSARPLHEQPWEEFGRIEQLQHWHLLYSWGKHRKNLK